MSNDPLHEERHIAEMLNRKRGARAEHVSNELVSMMYAAFQRFAPESDVGIDLSVEYRVAIR
jgi:hypothetical protein